MRKFFNDASPYWPDFSEPVITEFEFDTWINVSRDGTEQRLARRPFARGAVEYDNWLQDDDLTTAHALRDNPAGLLVFPFGYAHVRLTADAGLGDSVLLVDEDAAWAVPGSRIVLRGETADEAAEILSVNAGVITLTAGLNAAFPEGTRAFRAVRGWAEAKKAFRMISRGFDTSGMRFDVDPVELFISRTDVGDVYDDYEVFRTKMNWGAAPRREEDPTLDKVDGGRGLYDVFDYQRVHGWTRKENHLLEGHDEIDGFRDFFLRHKGRQKPFIASHYLPTFGATGVDLILGPGPRRFNVADVPTYEARHPLHPNHRFFEFSANDGSTPQITARIPPDAGERVLRDALQQPRTTHLLVDPSGPGEEHIDQGLVRLVVDVVVRYAYPDDSGASSRLTGEVSFDVNAPNDLDDSRRWVDLVREPGNFNKTVGNPDYIVQADGDPDPFLKTQYTAVVPAGTRFALLHLFFQATGGFGNTPAISSATARLEWDEYQGDLLQTFDPIVAAKTGQEVRADAMGTYRFDQDMLSMEYVTAEVAETQINLRALPVDEREV